MEPGGANNASVEPPGARPSAATDADLHDEARRLEVESALSEVIGVTAARIVPGFERAIDEIHIVSRPEHHPKPLVRNVQSLLYARFGISIDHRIVSIAQIDVEAPRTNNDVAAPTDERVSESSADETAADEAAEGEATAQPRLEAGRPRLVGVTATMSGLDVNVTVCLAVDDRELEGTETGPASASGRRRATARATLVAAHRLLPGDERVELEGVAVDHVLGRELAVSLIHFHGPRGARTLAGTAIVHDDEHAAVARSVLDAINRQLHAPAGG